MANPNRPDQRDSVPKRSSGKSNKGLFIGIAVVVVLLILLFFGGFFTDDTIIEEDAAFESTTPEVGTTGNEDQSGEEVEIITSDPDGAAPETQPDATAPATETDTAAPADPDADTQGVDEVIEIEGDAEVEINDES